MQKSPYYPRLDFFHGAVTPTLLLIKHFRTYRQTTEYTCGAAALWMLLNHWGITNKNELELAEEMNIRSEDNPSNGSYGCKREAIETALRNRNIDILPYKEFQTPELFATFIKHQLQNFCPVLVEWCIWGGHWNIIIGYDDMGTPSTQDDILIMADSYDTYNHNQDGYIIVPFERFFYEWFDAGVLSPGVIRQQYVAPIKPHNTFD